MYGFAGSLISLSGSAKNEAPCPDYDLDAEISSGCLEGSASKTAATVQNLYIEVLGALHRAHGQGTYAEETVEPDYCFPYLRLKRSTRPAVSAMRCLPV